MPGYDSKIFQILMESFREEAHERLAEMDRILLQLEAALEGAGEITASAHEPLHTLYRDFHSLKGAARTVEFYDIQEVCQASESLLAVLRDQAVAKDGGWVGLLIEALDLVKALIRVGQENEAPIPTEVIVGLTDRLNGSAAALTAEPASGQPIAAREPAADEQTVVPVVEPAPAPILGLARSSDDASDHPIPSAVKSSPETLSPGVPPETVRIKWSRLEALLRTAQELVSVKTGYMHLNERVGELVEELRQYRRWRRTQNPAHPIPRVQTHESAVNLSARPGVLLESDELAQTTEKSLEDLRALSRRNLREMAKSVAALQEELKEALMLPCATLLDTFPRIVRDLAVQLGKKVTVELSGGDLGMDRRTLEEIRVPLIHLLRNCVDHGIESPAAREAAGKSPQGRIAITAARSERDKIRITIEDDGQGIDWAAVRGKAVERGLVAAEEAPALTDEQLVEILFESDISTARMITNVSGRGLGMGIVRSTVEKLGGSVVVRSREGGGAAFDLFVPQALSSCRGVVVSLGERRFIVPMSSVEIAILVDLKHAAVAGGRKVVTIHDRPVPLAGLADLLGLDEAGPGSNAPTGSGGDTARRPALILAVDGRRAGLVVDDIGRELDVILKSMGPQLKYVRHIAGVSMLGSGDLVPVLNPADLMRSVLEAQGGMARMKVNAAVPSPRVLIVEDSLTSRTLLQNILTMAGFDVHAVVNGAEALTFLDKTPVDAVVSDVEMPIVDGFTLTERLRASEAFADLPVILVTSLDTPDFRRRGLDAGADAYIVKGGFDQTNLIETLRKLIS